MSSWKEKIERLRGKRSGGSVQGGGKQPAARSAVLPRTSPAKGSVRVSFPQQMGGQDASPLQPTYHVERYPVSLPPEERNKLVDRILDQLYETLDLGEMSELGKAQAAERIRRHARAMLEQAEVTLNLKEKQQLVEDIVDEMNGYGPLEPLLRDPEVSDILVNGSSTVYVERNGRLELTDVQFRDDAHLLRVIDRMVRYVGRYIDEGNPMCDARLPDGSRMNAIIPPAAIDYPSLSVRKFRADVLRIEDLVNRFGTLTDEIALVLEACVKARLNILISGGTGSGKTTLLNVLSSFIPHDERIVTIEDAAELQLRQPHVVRLETRPPNIEGEGEVTQYDLLRNSLRMRPDRIILGEVRGKEALDMLQAMNTGHEGSMSTIHANSPRDALSRLETMIAMRGLELPPRAMRQQIASAIHVVVQANRFADGSRKLTHISEVLGMEGEMVTMQDLFVFRREGIGEDGRVKGEFVATGVQPRFLQRLQAAGIALPSDLFTARSRGS